MNNCFRRYTEDYPRVDISAIKQKGLFSEYTQGRSFAVTGGNEKWSFNWFIFSDSITIHYTYKDQSYAYSANLIIEQPNYGGIRHYIECPTCNNKRKQLYIDGKSFACRTCLSLYYKSQSEGQLDRKFRKKSHLYEKVDQLENSHRFTKLKWQRWPSFKKIQNQIQTLDELILKAIT